MRQLLNHVQNVAFRGSVFVVPAGGRFGFAASRRGKCSKLSEVGWLRIVAYRRRHVSAHGTGAFELRSAHNFHRAEVSSRLKHMQFHSFRAAWRRFCFFRARPAQFVPPTVRGRATTVLKMVLGQIDTCELRDDCNRGDSRYRRNLARDIPSSSIALHR